MDANEVFDRQLRFPQVVRLFHFLPDRPRFALREFDPATVTAVAHLPPYLVVGGVDAASFSATPQGWTVCYRGIEPDTLLRVSYERARHWYTLQQEWRGINGGQAHASAALPIGQVVLQCLYLRFPSSWDEAARSHFEGEYQLRYCPSQANLATFTGVPDGAFYTIAFPLSAQVLKNVKPWLSHLVEAERTEYSVGATAKLMLQVVNYVEGRAPSWTTNPVVVLDHSMTDTGTVPLSFPEREQAPGSAAWTLRRPVYLLQIVVPFAGLDDVLRRLSRPSGPVRRVSDPLLRCELRPLVFPTGYDLQAKNINVWDADRTTRCGWFFEDPFGRAAVDGTGAPDEVRESDALEVERISVEVTRATRGLMRANMGWGGSGQEG